MRSAWLLLVAVVAGSMLLWTAAGRLSSEQSGERAKPIAGGDPGARVWSSPGSEAADEQADASDRSESYGGGYALEQRDAGHYAARVRDPTGLDRRVVDLTTDESLGDGQAVRMQLQGSPILQRGREVWILNEFYFPRDFPNLSPRGWLSLSSVYGPPGEGAGPNTLSMRRLHRANHLTWVEEPGGESVLWEGRVATRGVWHVVVRHMKLDTDPKKGFMEIFYGRHGGPLRLQRLSGSASGKTRRYYATLRPGVNWDGSSPNGLNISNYHRDGMPGWDGQVSIFFANHRIFPGDTTPRQLERYVADH
jgi:hypothetical protein